MSRSLELRRIMKKALILINSYRITNFLNWQKGIKKGVNLKVLSLTTFLSIYKNLINLKLLLKMKSTLMFCHIKLNSLLTMKNRNSKKTVRSLFLKMISKDLAYSLHPRHRIHKTLLLRKKYLMFPFQV